MSKLLCPIVSISNQKSGVGKTTTSLNLAQAFALLGKRVLLVDLDPQGNASQGMGIPLNEVETSVADLIRNRDFPISDAIYKGDNLDIIPATPLLAAVEREMVGITNSEHRLARHLHKIREEYSLIILDTPPTFGPLMNSALNTATKIIVPIDSSYFALVGIKELLSEISEIRDTTNPNLEIFGYLLTLCDQTKMTAEIVDSLVSNFGDIVFETKIRRSVRLREAPALGKTIFHHAPGSSGADDYMALAREVERRFSLEFGVEENVMNKNNLVSENVASVQGGCRE